MAKRSATNADLDPSSPQKSARTATKDAAPTTQQEGEQDEGMGEFEDRWEDDVESDGEVVVDGDDNDEDVIMHDDIIPAIEDSDPLPSQLPQPEPYLPTSRPLAADEILEPDNSVYLALHQLSYTWPCLSFDVLRDDLGWERSRFPHTAFVVAGTQAGEEQSGGGRGKDEVVVMKWGGLSKTQRDGREEDDEDDEDDDDDDEDVDEEAHLEYLSIPHTGSVNRIRAQPLPPSPALLPPASTPYHTATFSETGKVHIFDIRPLLTLLASPATAPASNPLTRRPVHTITAHGRNEGFALDWGLGSSASDLRLLSGDIASQIYLTTTTPTGFSTQPKPFLSHTSSIEDLQWSPSEPTVFASCSADRSIRVWDVRVKNRKNVVGVEKAHEEDVNVISWNKGVEYLLVSGGDEGGVKVWDLRNFKSLTTASPTPSPVASFNWHRAPITSLEWHPTDTSLFCASSADDSVTLWDLSVEADDDEASAQLHHTASGEEVVVPPQLLFVHQGQKDVKEVHWHPQIPGMVCTTAGDGFNAFKTISA